VKNEKMFEVATRNKLRFPFKGMISTEDLWDLSVGDLDTIFKQLNSLAKQAEEESLLNSKSKQDKMLEVRIGIIKHIVTTKLEEAENREKSQELYEQKQKILEIIANKQDASLETKSIEELEKMLEDLNA